MSADILEFVGYGWAAVVAGFWGGWLYLRVRTMHENLF